MKRIFVLAGIWALLTALVGCLVSPVTWTHHLLWFLPAVVVLVDATLDRRRWRWAIFALVVYATTSFSVVAFYDWHILTITAC